MSRDQVWSKGDTEPPVRGTIEEDDGTPPDNLNLAEIKFHMRNEDTGDKKIDGKTATLVDASTGEVKYEWDAEDTDTVATFESWWTVHWADGKMTVPNAGNEPLEITEEGE